MSDRLESLDCQQALDRLYEYLDGEITPETEQAIKEHLEACAPCFSLFNFEDRFLKFLEDRTSRAGAPGELRERIMKSVLDAGSESET